MTPYIYITYVYLIPWWSGVPGTVGTVVLWDESQDSTMFWWKAMDHAMAWILRRVRSILKNHWKHMETWISPQHGCLKIHHVLRCSLFFVFSLPPSESNCASGFTEQHNNVRVTVFLPKLVWVNRPQRGIDKGITMSCWPSSLSARFRGARLGFWLTRVLNTLITAEKFQVSSLWKSLQA